MITSREQLEQLSWHEIRSRYGIVDKLKDLHSEYLEERSLIVGVYPELPAFMQATEEWANRYAEKAIEYFGMK